MIKHLPQICLAFWSNAFGYQVSLFNFSANCLILNQLFVYNLELHMRRVFSTLVLQRSNTQVSKLQIHHWKIQGQVCQQNYYGITVLEAALK